ncbi:MAG TPA: hypothetical protein VJ464_17955 [Blastocatellia bacterium]|nr:hypothetical protein [Blastocatellia bacterium]
MTQKSFAPARRQQDLYIFPRLAMAASLALWLIPNAAGAPPPAANPEPQAAQSPNANPDEQDQINQTFKAFEGLLTITKDADSMNGHLRVRLESWREAQAAWEKAYAALPSSLKSLKRCAVPLAAARGMIERADNLFRQARASSDAMRGADLLIRHQKLLKQAEDRLQRAERCYRALRTAYLKSGKIGIHSQVRMAGEP